MYSVRQCYFCLPYFSDCCRWTALWSVSVTAPLIGPPQVAGTPLFVCSNGGYAGCFVVDALFIAQYICRDGRALNCDRENSSVMIYEEVRSGSQQASLLRKENTTEANSQKEIKNGGDRKKKENYTIPYSDIATRCQSVKADSTIDI